MRFAFPSRGLYPLPNDVKVAESELLPPPHRRQNPAAIAGLSAVIRFRRDEPRRGMIVASWQRRLAAAANHRSHPGHRARQLNLTWAHSNLRAKLAGKKLRRAGAVQDATRHENSRTAPSVLDCGSPLPLFPAQRETAPMLI